MMSRKMKNSGVSWINEIPEEWQTIPLRRGMTFINEINKPIKFSNILSLMKDKGVVRYEDKGAVGNNKKEDLTKYKLAYKDTIVVNSMNAKIGSVGISSFDGCVSPVYYVLSPRENFNISYLGYIFETREYQKYMGSFGKGILEIREKISTTDLKQTILPCPPIDNQIKISTFLNKKCRIIDDEVEKLQKSWLMLEEYKKNNIYEFIHWQGNKHSKFSKRDEVKKFTKLKRMIKIHNGKDCVKSNDNTKYPVYGSGGVFAYTDKYIHNGESVLIGRKGTIDKPLHINEKFWTVDTMFYSTAMKNVNLKYVYYFLCTVNWKRYITSTAIPSMTQSTLNDFQVPLRSYDNQCVIVEELDSFCNKIDSTINIIKDTIPKLNEYKKSLIYEAVTGKIEV